MNKPLIDKFKKLLQGFVLCKWCDQVYDKADSFPEHGHGGYGFKNPDGSEMKCPYCRIEPNNRIGESNESS